MHSLVGKLYNTEKLNHKFNPCRFIVIHGEDNDAIIKSNLDKFNHDDNTYGKNIMLIILIHIHLKLYHLNIL